MHNRRFKQAAMLLLGITFLAYSPLVLAAESGSRMLGTVVATGNASMKAALDRWLPVDEKTHPVVDGTALKTEEGTMSLTMKDGASFEVGKRTGLLVGGTVSNYSMQLQMGTIAFKLYEGIGLSLTTPSTSVAVQRVSGNVETTRHTFKDEISGVITHDGKDTQVVCLSGKFSVMQAGAETWSLTEGNTIAVKSLPAATQAQGTAWPVSVSSAAPPASLLAYESPKVPPLKELQTGGLEVVSEKIP